MQLIRQPFVGVACLYAVAFFRLQFTHIPFDHWANTRAQLLRSFAFYLYKSQYHLLVCHLIICCFYCIEFSSIFSIEQPSTLLLLRRFQFFFSILSMFIMRRCIAVVLIKASVIQEPKIRLFRPIGLHHFISSCATKFQLKPRLSRMLAETRFSPIHRI